MIFYFEGEEGYDVFEYDTEWYFLGEGDDLFGPYQTEDEAETEKLAYLDFRLTVEFSLLTGIASADR